MTKTDETWVTIPEEEQVGSSRVYLISVDACGKNIFPDGRGSQLRGQDDPAGLHPQGVLHPLAAADPHRRHDRILRVPAAPARPVPAVSGGRGCGCCECEDSRVFSIILFA